MSTRSIIASITEDGKYKAIYCQYDGYPEGVGQTLLDHYNDQDKIDAHREAIKYVNQYGTNKTYMVINLNNCVDLG